MNPLTGMMLTKKIRAHWIVMMIGLGVWAVACGDSGDETSSGDGDGDGDVGDGDAGDGDPGDGDTGDGDTGDGDTGDGDSMGGTGMGGNPSMGGTAMGGGDPGTSGCTGTATTCEMLSADVCNAAGCVSAPGCSGDRGCENNDSPRACNNDAERTCSWGPICGGMVDSCQSHMMQDTCEALDGCTWNE